MFLVYTMKKVSYRGGVYVPPTSSDLEENPTDFDRSYNG